MPVPKRYPGISFPINEGLVKLELFADPLCPNCLTIWPTMKYLMGNFSTQLQVIVHLVPLPYHTWSFIITQTLMAVNSINNSLAQAMINDLYNGSQDLFSNSATATLSESQVLEKALQYASTTFSIDYDKLKEEYNNQNMNARIEFKFAAEHEVSGTPTLFLNGVDAGYDEITYDIVAKDIQNCLNTPKI